MGAECLRWQGPFFISTIPWRNQALVEIPLEPQPWVALL